MGKLTRRGFLTFGAAAGVIPVFSLASGGAESSDRGFVWKLVCPDSACGRELEQFIDMTQPIRYGTQCPSCLSVYNSDGLAKRVRQWNVEHGVPTSIRTWR